MEGSAASGESVHYRMRTSAASTGPPANDHRGECKVNKEKKRRVFVNTYSGNKVRVHTLYERKKDLEKRFFMALAPVIIEAMISRGAEDTEVVLQALVFAARDYVWPN